MKYSRMVVALLAVLVIASPRVAAAQSASYKVIVNRANPVSSLSRDELSRLFLKKVTTWSDAKPVAVVEQKPTSPVREEFTKSVHGRQLGYVTSYWQQMIFSGRATPPPEKSSDAEISAFVAGNPSAIGYVEAGTPLPSGVKVLNVSM
jgi:ABC-type phosphate transport system substrate-binding protein